MLERPRVFLMMTQGLFIALITMLAFLYCLYRMDQDLERARTVTFTVSVFARLAQAFNCRSDETSMLQLGWTTNRPLLWAVLLAIGFAGCDYLYRAA